MPLKTTRQKGSPEVRDNGAPAVVEETFLEPPEEGCGSARRHHEFLPLSKKAHDIGLRGRSPNLWPQPPKSATWQRPEPALTIGQKQEQTRKPLCSCWISDVLATPGADVAPAIAVAGPHVWPAAPSPFAHRSH